MMMMKQVAHQEEEQENDDIENPIKHKGVVDGDDGTGSNEDSAASNKSCCRRWWWVWLILALFVLGGIVVGILFGLDVIETAGGGGRGGYEVETEWSVVNNCLYSFCYQKDTYATFAEKLKVGKDVEKRLIDGVLTTTFKSIEGDEATFEVSSNVLGCIRTSTVTATIGSGSWSEWSNKHNCGFPGGTVVVTQARVKVS